MKVDAMIKSAAGHCFWKYDDEDEYRMLFVARLPDRSERVLLQFRTFEQEKFLSAAVLIGERQHLWGQWRRIAERDGHRALDKILTSIQTTDYLESVIDVTIVKDRGHPEAVTMSVHLLPKRQVDVICHTFASAEARVAFLAWVEKAGLGRRVGLCLTGLLEGSKALAVEMDTIAETELAFGHKVMRALIAAVGEGKGEVFIPASEATAG